MRLFKPGKKTQTALLLAAFVCTAMTPAAQAQIDDTVDHYFYLGTQVQKSDDTILELFSFVDGFAWETENKRKIAGMLSTRIETLETRRTGLDVTFPPVTQLATQGPPARLYSDDWIPDADPPKRMKKKACKAGDWDGAGYAQGAYGRSLEEQLALASKKCLKHDIRLDAQAYTAGHQRGLKDYCGYERGLYVIARESSLAQHCYDKGFASFDTGLRHGRQKLPYYTVRNAVYRDANLIRGMYYSLAKARRGIPSSTEEPVIYTWHENILDQDSARSERDVQDVQIFKAKNPLVLTAPKTWNHIRADKDLDYPLPE